MIISHKHKYVFVELPRTGSTAISKELRELYDGQEILKKHSTYREFLGQANDSEQQYFSFSAIRNPMDKILSLYFKYKTNQRGYDRPETYNGSNVLVTQLMKSQFRFVQDHDASFEEFFRRYYFLPYDDWSSLDHCRLDYIIHFENLSEGFEEVLHQIGIQPQRCLPQANKTAGRSTDFWSYYSPAIRPRARWVFGPYFQRWGYNFPENWPEASSARSELVFRMVNIVRGTYWRYIRR